ncbi:MAG: hypothetical protein QM831_35490 [Kofleriaceae bacterium]
MKRVLLLIGLLACESDHEHPLPSDVKLRDIVRTHGRELDQLRAMIGEDAALGVVGVEHVGECWRLSGEWSCNGFHPDDEAAMLAHAGLAVDRYARYRELLAKVGGLSVSGHNGEAEVAMFSAGIVTSGIGKSLVWTMRAPTPIVDDTDRDRPVKFAIRYAVAGEHWYIEEMSN